MADAEYLLATVGPALRTALAAMVVAQPADAVEFLGEFLLHEKKVPAPVPENPPPAAVDPPTITAETLELSCIKALSGASTASLGLKDTAVDGSPILCVIESTDSSVVGFSLRDGATMEMLSTNDVLYVENVVREPRMQFFGVPRIGAYLGIAIRYASSLHGQVEMALMLDTLGTSRAFGSEIIERCKAWALRYAADREEKDRKDFESSPEIPDTKEIAGQIERECERLTDQRIAAVDALDIPDERKVLKKQSLHVEAATTTLQSCVRAFEVMSRVKIPPPSNVLHLLVAMLLVLGADDTSFDKTGNPGVPDWAKIAPHLAADDLSPKFGQVKIAADSDFMLRVKPRLLEPPTDFSDAILRLHTWLTHLLTLYDHTKAVADAEAESSSS